MKVLVGHAARFFFAGVHFQISELGVLDQEQKAVRWNIFIKRSSGLAQTINPA